MNHAKIVVVEAQRAIRDRFGEFLCQNGHKVEHLNPQDRVIQKITCNNYDLILAEDGMPNLSTVELLSLLRIHQLLVPVIVVGNGACVRSAVEAIHCGAKDFLLLSEDKAKLNEIILNELKTKEKIFSNRKMDMVTTKMVANGDSMQHLLQMAKRIAPSGATVLIQGESGTGKELIAKYIHLNSGRGEQAFVAMNCAALPENLAESELFGYEKGAFTGAVTRRSGRFEPAESRFEKIVG